MDDHPIAFLDRIRVEREVVGGDALEQNSRRDLGRDSVGDGDEPGGIGRDSFRIAVWHVDPRHPLAGLRDGAGTLDAHDCRRLLAVVQSLALIDVSKVDAHRLDVNENLAVARRRIRHLFVVEDLGPTIAFEDHRVHQAAAPPT